MAKKRSSCSPMRSQTTPMNHKKAMPANGKIFMARLTPPSWQKASHPVLRVGRDRNTDERQAGDEQQRKQDPGHRRCARRRQSFPGYKYGLALCHYSIFFHASAALASLPIVISCFMNFSSSQQFEFLSHHCG